MGNTQCNCCGTNDHATKKEKLLKKTRNTTKAQYKNSSPPPLLQSTSHDESTNANSININDNMIDLPSPKEMKIDFSMFGVISTNCSEPSSKNSIISSCSYLQRIATGLQYFESVCNNSQITRNSFVQFCVAYDNILNDFIHFIKVHDDADQLIQINKELQHTYGFIQCNISQCNILKQHYDHKSIDSSDNDEDNIKFNFYGNCYNRIHHHIFHVFPMGLRVKPDTDIDIKEDELTDIHSSCVDQKFEIKRDLIRNQRIACGLKLERYNDENNKFILHVNNHNKSNTEDIIKGDTFLDGMYRYIKQRKSDITETELTTLKQYIAENEYDSDGIQENTNDIYENIKNESCLVLMREYINNIKLSAASFSTGFVFYYWDRYKSLAQQQIQRYDDNFKYEKNNGYSIVELLLSPHYKTLKDEIIESEFINIQDWNNKIMFKAEEYLQTNQVKNMKAGIRPDYSIKHEAPISISHLQCVILYCDYYHLCTHFKATFQKKDKYESIKSLTNRHCKYYHFAKALVEAVNAFGLTGGFLGSDSRNTEQGPFYFGLSEKLCMPSMSIYLKGPCSTSKNIEVCINVSKQAGTIVELQNDQWGQGAKQRFFDCSWMSNYCAENERLFIASTFRLKIQSIILIQTAQNFIQFFRAFHLFDHMVSSGGFLSHAVTDGVLKSDVEILSKMINNRAKNSTKNKHMFDEFVENTFDSFLFSKTEIRVNMYYLDSEFKKINYHLKVNSIVAETAKYSKRSKKWRQNLKRKVDYSDSTDTDNILNTKVFSIFPNLNKVSIHTTYNGNIDRTQCYLMYRFSLLSFLFAIDSCPKRIKYMITASPKKKRSGTNAGCSWLQDAFSESIKKEFNDKQWNINISNEQDKKGIYDKLTIEKMT
eukprot:214654_1